MLEPGNSDAEVRRIIRVAKEVSVINEQVPICIIKMSTFTQ